MTDSEIVTLAAEVGVRLAARGAMAATAESCTGGLVAGAITAIAGSSGWFDRGFVTYSNEAKMELLGVDPGTLARHGAVSEATAQAMAEGALRPGCPRQLDRSPGPAGPAGAGAATPGRLAGCAWPRPGARYDGGAAPRRRGGARGARRGTSVIVTQKWPRNGPGRSGLGVGPTPTRQQRLPLVPPPPSTKKKQLPFSTKQSAAIR